MGSHSGNLLSFFFLKGDSNYLLNFSQRPVTSEISSRGDITPVYEKTYVSRVTRSNRGEISPRGDFTSVLKTKAIFHPGINSVWFHSVTAINFHPSLILCAIRDHLFSTYAKFSEKLIFHTPWYAHVRNVSFSENLAYVLNRWTLLWLIQKILSHYHYFFC